MAVGFIGLGIMGKPMALNLLRGGIPLLVHDVNPQAVADVTAAGAQAASPAQIGANCEVVFLILPNGAIVSDVLFGEAGLARSAKPGAIICDMSSVTPDESQYCGHRLAESGVGFIDAPVSGGEPKAIDGSLAFMAGGTKSDLATIRPYLELMGSSVLLIGPVGSGSITKLTNQVIVNLTIAAISEAFVLATKAGTDPVKVYQAIRGGLAGSTVLDAKLPLIVERRFEPGGKIAINHKDITNVLTTARRLDCPMPLTSQLFEIMQALKAHGHFNDDHGGIVQYFEALADVTVTAPHAPATLNVAPTKDLHPFSGPRPTGASAPIHGSHYSADPSPVSVDVLSEYPTVDRASVQARLTGALAHLNRTIIVLDDDPTGVQTVNDVYVYTDWSTDTLIEAFKEPNAMFFIMTNSRGLTGDQTTVLHRDLARNIVAAAKACGKEYIIVARSDSTLRGHYPLETAVLRDELDALTGETIDGEILIPFFKEGGRFTIKDVHYVREGDQLTPAGMTEFARDKSFGYRSSHLGDYCEEKSGGVFRRADQTYISLDELRSGAIDAITAKLVAVDGFGKVIVNAIHYCDIETFMIAYCAAVAQGKRFLFRSAAAVPKVLGGVPDRPLLGKQDLVDTNNRHGGIVVVGSHVAKTNRQLDELRTLGGPLDFIEFRADRVREEGGLIDEIQRTVTLADASITAGRTVVVFTSRQAVDLGTDDADEILRASVAISAAVTHIVADLTVQPSFIIAKGGITSSDVGVKALNVRRATVMGQIKPGVPVWMTGDESRFPGMPYIIFPGNVGGPTTLKETVETLMTP